MAGTLDKLIFRLADENEQGTLNKIKLYVMIDNIKFTTFPFLTDNEFIDCFVLSHAFFISSKVFLENMISRFSEYKSLTTKGLSVRKKYYHTSRKFYFGRFKNFI